MREAEVERLQKNLFEEHRPSLREIELRNEALDFYGDWQDFGNPADGGAWSQNASWKHAMRTVLAAKRAADWDRAKVEAEDARIDADGGY